MKFQHCWLLMAQYVLLCIYNVLYWRLNTIQYALGKTTVGHISENNPSYQHAFLRSIDFFMFSAILLDLCRDGNHNSRYSHFLKKLPRVKSFSCTLSVTPKEWCTNT